MTMHQPHEARLTARAVAPFRWVYATLGTSLTAAVCLIALGGPAEGGPAEGGLAEGGLGMAVQDLQDPQRPDRRERVESTRAMLEEWVETRRLIARERREWRLGKELLGDQRDLLTREIDELRGRIEDAEKNISESDQKKLELEAELEKLKEASSSLEEIVAGLEGRTRKLLQRLPAPILERVEALTQQIPEDPSETELGLSDRFRNVVGILNEVNKFDSEVTLKSEVRTLSDGQTTAEVTTMYLGIGHAYYVTEKQDVAGIGTVSDDAWIWIPADEHAAEIARAIAIMKNEEIADFARVPVEIR